MMEIVEVKLLSPAGGLSVQQNGSSKCTFRCLRQSLLHYKTVVVTRKDKATVTVMNQMVRSLKPLIQRKILSTYLVSTVW